MNNELATELNDLSCLPTGSPSFLQHYQLERLHNRINQLLDREAFIEAEIEASSGRKTECRRQIEEANLRLENAKQVSEMFQKALQALWVCLGVFLSLDVQGAMKHIVDNIKTVNDEVHDTILSH